ncbi:hypothetical protein EDC14_102379 [Hydrogenispora ethanolica]|jgi:hypothetical protein|uniref:Integrase catalytic domain-containing protein n=1 Tax=Hydrogenispora ethanolica TaxID=1082276 RepID=A0A4R1RAQ5_HYDET|nr:hypothetical protein [Hydrogenispora ethanolica]TCL62798.1 hypothetical protein EDC14_102379 [Hydrogenispora ethanolica]
MIEIDDAGGGCFIGPEVLVIHHLETGSARFLYIPPQVENRISFATELLKAAFTELAITNQEPIQLCRGEIFDKFQEHLEQRGYHVIRQKVSSATDSLAEAEFMEVLYAHGLPRNIKLRNRNYQELYEMVGFWYFSQRKRSLRGLLKTRLRPPYRLKHVTERYPNLFRMLFQEEAAG